MGIKFWKLAPPESTSRLAEWDDSVKLGGPIYCRANPGHQRAGQRLTDLSVILPRNDVQDIVWTWRSECLVQDALLNALREQGFSGFDVRPVKARVETNDDRPAPTLWELVITGWAGIAPPRSGVRLIEKCFGCQLLRYSRFEDASAIIAEEQWDGSDFFMVWPFPALIFVTDRVALFIRARGFKGAVLQDPATLEWGNVIPVASPGRLSYYMPEDRARLLGEPLGIY